MTVLSADGKIISGDVISFLSSDEPSYPQLTRLYLEYDFRIIEVTKIGDENRPLHQFTMAYKDSADEQAVTPVFDSLHELELHTQEHVIEILQRTVFESTLIASE